MITVHDSGRNWSEEEVAALLNIWSEEGIQQQLQGSTRNKDVFVQISRRLLQQGVERDWKQCRTKYKNLKYLYRSLQRGKADIGDTRRIMKFYEQLDSILSQPVRGLYRNSGMFSPPTLEEHSICELPAHEDSDIIAVGYDQQTIDDAMLRSPGIGTRAYQNEARADAILRPEELTGVEYETADQLNGMLARSKDSVQTRYEEQPLSGHSVTAGTYGGGQEYKVKTGNTLNYRDMYHHFKTVLLKSTGNKFCVRVCARAQVTQRQHSQTEILPGREEEKSGRPQMKVLQSSHFIMNKKKILHCDCSHMSTKLECETSKTKITSHDILKVRKLVKKSHGLFSQQNLLSKKVQSKTIKGSSVWPSGETLEG